jgi:DedD protein
MNSDSKQVKFDLKQRITGALILISLAVIIVPLLLDFRQDYDQGITASNIPPKPDDFKIEVFTFDNNQQGITVPDLAVEALVTGSGDASSMPAAAKTDNSEPTPKEIDSHLSELQNRVRGSNVAGAPAVKAEAWVVQLASLTLESNAEVLQERVRKLGLHAFILRSQVEGKSMFRVLVGPELLRSNANKQRQRLLDELKLDGLVVKYER